VELTLIVVLVIALTFDFTNGFHDTANSIATIVGTRAMPPQAAVIWAATLNFVGAMAGSEIAATVGKGIIEPAQNLVTLHVAMAGLTGAIVWNLVTWVYGLPSSSSHALIGGLVGAALASGEVPVFWSGVREKVLVPSILAPTLGVIGGLVIMGVLMRVVKNMDPRKGNKFFRRAQIVSGGWLSFTHGLNDAQKTMGVMWLALIAAGSIPATAPLPLWVKVSAALAIALGTYAGGWKIIKTLGGKVVKMSPLQGFSASVAGASILQTAEHFGFPVSTTHTVTGCVLGAGASKRLSSVRWTVAGEIAAAWVMTLPAAAVVGGVAFALASISPVVLLVAAAAGIVYLRHRALAAGPVAAH
jgi:inorganic phosphate transporter, PiT family